MGNYRFRLADMMPNAWFYKLKDMSRAKNNRTSNSHSAKKKQSNSTKSSQKPHLSQPTNSYYYYTIDTTQPEKHYNSPSNPKASDTHFPDPPRRSSKKKPNRKAVYKPSPRRTTSSIPQTKLSLSLSRAECERDIGNFFLGISDERLSPPVQTRNHFDSSDESSAELDFIKSSSSSEFESDNINPNQSFNGLGSWSSSCSCRFSSSAADIIFDMNEKPYTSSKSDKIDDLNKISELEKLRPILTKPAKFNNFVEERNQSLARESFSIKIIKEESIKSRKGSSPSPSSSIAPRKSISQSTGVKVRANSPRLASKKFQNHGRKSLSSTKRSKSSKKKAFQESCAVVKASFDPEKDFRDSMMEMIIENNIRASKDLEELLACYLSLNLDEYHDLIIKAFEQIWFNMPEIHI